MGESSLSNYVSLGLRLNLLLCNCLYISNYHPGQFDRLFTRMVSKCLVEINAILRMLLILKELCPDGLSYLTSFGDPTFSLQWSGSHSEKYKWPKEEEKAGVLTNNLTFLSIFSSGSNSRRSGISEAGVWLNVPVRVKMQNFMLTHSHFN